MTIGLNCVSAENNTLIMSSEVEEDELKIKNEEDRTGDLVGASEDGHYNISFDDGYNGYCINYGDEEATKGNNFIVKDTSEAINRQSKQSIGNELKTFFVEYYDIAMQDTVKTQHIIWHFSDDFTGKRVDSKLMEEIKATSSQKIIPDHGAVKKINNTTEAVFDFEVLQSTNPGHQNFFAYKITYREIVQAIINETSNNNSNLTNDTLKNESTPTTPENKTNTSENTPVIPKNKTENIKAQIKEDNTKNDISNENDSKDSKSHKSYLKKHVTGYNFIPALIILLLGTLLLVKYARD